MITAKNWKGNDLKGSWEFSIKIDGVRVLVGDGVAVSRNGKPLYNVPPSLPDGDYECYLGSFKETISALKTKHANFEILPKYFFSLDPLDPRLYIEVLSFPTAFIIEFVLHLAIRGGNEGLVLRQGDKWLKVKKQETHDVRVLGIQEGTGKYEGKMGALITEVGNIGTGFTDKEREEFTSSFIIGKVIEVSGMELTESGKLRHPRFVRLREDKS